MSATRVLVSDTSVLIDLERGSLLECALSLPFTFAVPDLLYKRELEAHGGDYLVRLGLAIEGLDSKGVELAREYRRRRRSLSLPDSFALALAKTNSWTLLSGDKELRSMAAQEEVDCHGVLWLTDRMFEHNPARALDLCKGLAAIRDHPRCRLPRAEITKRFTAYSNN
ncbi:PIN domain-containing protein [Candidatus Foliamicus sp.]